MENKGCCAVPSDNSCSTGKKCCFGTIIKGAFIGAIVMFIYFAASWMYLPWHKTTMMSFANEGIVASILANNAPQSGIYTLPGMPVNAAAKPEMTKPFAFVSVFTNGIDMKNMSPVPCMVKAFLMYLFGAALLTKLLKKISYSCCPMFGSFVIGVLVATFSYVPNMIWFHFPVAYSLVGMGDTIVAITLAGIAISCCLFKKGACNDKKAA